MKNESPQHDSQKILIFVHYQVLCCCHQLTFEILDMGRGAEQMTPKGTVMCRPETWKGTRFYREFLHKLYILMEICAILRQIPAFTNVLFGILDLLLRNFRFQDAPIRAAHPFQPIQGSTMASRDRHGEYPYCTGKGFVKMPCKCCNAVDCSSTLSNIYYRLFFTGFFFCLPKFLADFFLPTYSAVLPILSQISLFSCIFGPISPHFSPK